jgi:hypothetical protein
MAGFGTKGKLPGSEGAPIHGAVQRAQRSFDEHTGNLSKTVGDTGNAIAGIPGGIQTGLQGAGHAIFGGLFGGGSEQAAVPASPAPARPVTGATRMQTTSSPVASARPLVVAPMNPGPSYSQQPSVAGKSKTGDATKKRRKKK